MTIKELVNSCLLLWDENDLFSHNKDFKITISSDNSSKTFNPWDDEWFYKEHNEKVISWKILKSNPNELFIIIK